MLSTKTQVAISHLGEKYVSYNGERPKLRMGQGYKKIKLTENERESS